MSRSSAISTLLIFTLCIVGEVLSAPREERTREKSTQEKFLETREAELLEQLSRASRNERLDLSREDEMLLRTARLIKEPAPSVKNESKEATTKTPTILDKPKDNSTSIAETSEAKDMTESHVTPNDVDDSTDGTTQLSKVPESTPKNSTSVGQPKNKTNESESNVTTKATTMTPLAVVGISNITTTSSKTSPTTTVVTSESPTTSTTTSVATTNATTAATITATSNATTTTTTTIVTSPTIVTKTPTVMTTSSSTKSEVITDKPMTFSSTEMYSKAEMQLHEKKPTSMPSGVVALITAIAFAIVAVTAYIGLVAWRRYLEWRYGSRELLVNEFDANDIGNFEL